MGWNLEKLSKTRTLLGDDLLKHILACTSQQIELLFNDKEAAWTDGQKGVILSIEKLGEPGVVGDDENVVDMNLAGILGQRVEGSGPTLASLLRLSAGGEVSSLESSDSILIELSKQLVDVYPLLLIPRRGPFAFGAHGLLSRHLFLHPSREAFENAVRADADLMRLLPDENETTGLSGQVQRSTGRGGGVQLWGLPGQLISVAWDWSKMAVDSPSIDDVFKRLEDGIKILRAAARGESVATTMQFGLAGVLLPDGCEQLDLGEIRLRRSDRRHESIIAKTDLGGQLTTARSDGTMVAIDYSGDIVATMSVPYRIDIGKIDETSQWPQRLQVIQESVAKIVENVQLALALACGEGGQRVVVALSWMITVDPLDFGLYPSYRDTRQVVNLNPRQLTESEASSWALWYERVALNRVGSVDVSIRRILQALGERRNPEDVLVDSIIVWENLFGANGETVLRVSAAMARLLGEGIEDRKVKQKRYKELYALRSSIVHGAPKVQREKLMQASIEAVDISIQALRAVFSVRTDLLKEGDSAVRSNQLLLEG